jgi:tRNA dimethylallyltransferase
MKIIVQILGPTGVGKSKIAVELALALKGEVISADSMQVYRDFNIGTDKISLQEMQGIPHHLIDILSDCSQFNASKFLEKSFEIAEGLVKKGKLPIVCGGTALYLKTMIQGIFPEATKKRVSREKLERVAERRGTSYLWQKLKHVDPEYADKIGQNDKIRIIRALEIYYNNKKPPTDIFRETISPFFGYKFIRVGLNIERKDLYRRIEERVEEMINRNLLGEVIELREKYGSRCPPFKSLGYKEVLLYLDNKISWKETISLIKQHSRNFAKRQLSWFRQESDIVWFKPTQYREIEQYVSRQLG